MRKHTGFKNAIKAVDDALWDKVSDPTTCVVNFCAKDPCPSTDSNKYWMATNKIKIKKHFFVSRVKRTTRYGRFYCIQWLSWIHLLK